MRSARRARRPERERSEAQGLELVACEIKLETRRDGAQLSQSTGLELAHALARDAEPGSHFLERLRIGVMQTEAQRQHVTHAWVEPRKRLLQLRLAEIRRRGHVGTFRLHVLDQVAVQRLAVADG